MILISFYFYNVAQKEQGNINAKFVYQRLGKSFTVGVVAAIWHGMPQKREMRRWRTKNSGPLEELLGRQADLGAGNGGLGTRWDQGN